MAKLYLIRRNIEAFAGPMTLAELRDAYKRMQFGLSDEVSGHCGPWVTLDNLEKIKKQYPEVARLVHEDMLEGWGISSDSDGKLIQEETKRVKVKSNKGVGLALTFLLIAVLAFVAAVYMANSAKPKAKDQLDSSVKPEAAQSLLDRGDRDGFDRFMQAHSAEVVDQVTRLKPAETPWLPYLRSYAFAHDGQIPGVEAKILRGSSAPAAPVDCSIKVWRRRWRASYKNWNDVLVDHKLVRAHWARLLAWDPYWIKRRDNKGWIGGQNYYTSCLTMASRALADVASDPTTGPNAAEWEKYGLARIKARLDWQLVAAQKGAASVPMASPATSPAALLALTTNDGVSLWTCFEGARDMQTLQRCRQTLPPATDVWHAYNEERYGWNLLRLAAATHGNLAPDLAAQLTQQVDKMNQEDHFTRFDYHPEARLLNSLLSPEVPADKTVEKAVEKTQTEFPDVKLSH